MSDAIKVVEWVVEQHQTNIVASGNGMAQKDFKGSVTLLSPDTLVADNSDFESLKSALDAATGAGVHIVVAATPDNRDECRSSMAPANAITVGASTLGRISPNLVRALTCSRLD